MQDILAARGVPFAGADHKHGRPGWVQVDCPYCGGGAAKFHMGISLTTGACACWKCGKHNTARVLGTLTGMPTRKCRELLDGADTVAPPRARTGKLVRPAGLGPLAGVHRAYLAKRRLDATQVAALWGVLGTKQLGGKWRQLSWRLWIPFHYRGEVVSWTTRSIRPKGGLRYLSAAADQEAMPHKELLYGADYATSSVIIHEGQVDVWATGPGAVATSGTAYTEAQLKAMARYPVRCVCFDSSPAAQDRARNLCRDLAAFPGTTHQVELESGGDAAEADPEELQELRDAYL